MEPRPEIPDGYLGEQPKFTDLGFSCLTNKNPEFSLDVNHLELDLKSTKPVKFTTNLLQCKDESKNLSEFVFTQRCGDVIHFAINFPESGYYKFQIFALASSEEGSSLPNVYNYLIHVKRAVNAIYPFPKQYSQWKEGCSLQEPMILNSSCSLCDVKFKVKIPKAKAAAVVIGGKEWNHLQDKGSGNFEGKVKLDHCRHKNVKVTVNANFEGEDSTTYPTLLEYTI